jgi:hypothetical protein
MVTTSSFVVILLFVVFLSFNVDQAVAVGNATSLFSLQTATAPWTARSSAFLVNWAGGLWLAGGLTTSGAGLSDLWSSGDMGLTWQPSSSSAFNATTTAPALPGACAAGDAKAFDTQVSLWCGITSASPIILTNAVYSTSDPLLRYWQSSVAPWSPRYGFVTGVFNTIPGAPQTVVFVAGKGASLVTDVWTYTASGAAYQLLTASAPFTPRVVPAAAMGQDGQVMIIAGGQQLTGGLNVYLNDVWSLRLRGGVVATWTLLTGRAPWPPRTQAVGFNVGEYLYVTAGNIGGNDLWVTPDYGATWMQVSASANYPARSNPNVVAVGRQVVLVGGSGLNYVNLQDVWTGFF